MKIRAVVRISGISPVAYRTAELDCESFRVLKPGDRYTCGSNPERRAGCYALQLNGTGSVYELKRGTVPEELLVDDQDRVGVVDGPRRDFCVEHGVASCSHQGM